MKAVLLLCAVMVLWAAAEGQGRGCIYVLGTCHEQCPEGTHSYTTGCGLLKSERTCDNPVSTVDQRGLICDYSRCECDEPNVKDMGTGKCVLIENCPKGAKKEGEATTEKTVDPKALVGLRI